MSDAAKKILVKIADGGPICQPPRAALLELLSAGLVIRGEAVTRTDCCWGLTEAGWRARQDIARGVTP